MSSKRTEQFDPDATHEDDATYWLAVLERAVSSRRDDRREKALTNLRRLLPRLGLSLEQVATATTAATAAAK